MSEGLTPSPTTAGERRGTPAPLAKNAASAAFSLPETLEDSLEAIISEAQHAAALTMEEKAGAALTLRDAFGETGQLNITAPSTVDADADEPFPVVVSIRAEAPRADTGVDAALLNSLALPATAPRTKTPMLGYAVATPMTAPLAPAAGEVHETTQIGQAPVALAEATRPPIPVDTAQAETAVPARRLVVPVLPKSGRRFAFSIPQIAAGLGVALLLGGVVGALIGRAGGEAPIAVRSGDADEGPTIEPLPRRSNPARRKGRVAARPAPETSSPAVEIQEKPATAESAEKEAPSAVAEKLTEKAKEPEKVRAGTGAPAGKAAPKPVRKAGEWVDPFGR